MCMEHIDMNGRIMIQWAPGHRHVKGPHPSYTGLTERDTDRLQKMQPSLFVVNLYLFAVVLCVFVVAGVSL